MGIQPIDLQTLYTQLDKVGKLQGDARQTFAAEFENSQQGAEKTAINKDGSNGSSGGAFNNTPQQQKNETPLTDEKSYYIQDPLLGKKIDISG